MTYLVGAKNKSDFIIGNIDSSQLQVGDYLYLGMDDSSCIYIVEDPSAPDLDIIIKNSYSLIKQPIVSGWVDWSIHIPCECYIDFYDVCQVTSSTSEVLMLIDDFMGY